MALVLRLGSWLLCAVRFTTELESNHMATCRVKVRPSGLINGHDWPEVGGTLELPEAVAEDMAAAGWLEVVKDEKKVEKRPASRKGVETRKD